MTQDRICSTPGCGTGGKLTRGMCSRCYRYWLDHTPVEEREIAPRFVDDFWSQVEKTHDYGCWLWTGKADPKGYGRWKSKHLAHREAWRRERGPIPDGIWILHHCDTPPCVNPAHLYPGTVVENVRDAVARGRAYRPPRKTHCPRGHAKEGDNLVVVHQQGREVHRCRTCENERSNRRQKEARRSRGLRQTRLSDDERSRIVALRREGRTHPAIAREVGRGIATVGRILRDAGV
ncbi:HNH endonuclease [Actinomadura litoris]|uniref:Helix-turn-helix domain-containing protein n=1 Tax=Actinomadura litoris TaxID=2678616 RepID=A0A7K1LAH5_9ACTN|nr:helix-turn-helix domain-containing protein [Actinomadura litoris]